jgi:hypothetical protein
VRQAGVVDSAVSAVKQAHRADRGIVAETSWASITIKWDSRTDQTIMHNDMGQIDRVR